MPENNSIPGAAIAIQTFGDFLGFNPHCHVLVTDGCFFGRGMFRVAPPLDLKKLEAIFRHKVFKTLLAKGRIARDLIAFLPEAQFASILAANASRFHQYKNLTAEDVRAMAAKSRKSGCGISEGLFYEGVTSIGVPIFNPQKEGLAAITVSSISQRMDEKRRQEIVRLVKKVARAEDLASLQIGRFISGYFHLQSSADKK